MRLVLRDGWVENSIFAVVRDGVQHWPGYTANIEMQVFTNTSVTTTTRSHIDLYHVADWLGLRCGSGG